MSMQDEINGPLEDADLEDGFANAEEADIFREDARELLAELSEFPIGMPEIAELSDEDEQWVRDMATGFLHEDSEFHDESMALLRQEGRQGYSDTLAQVGGVARRIAAVLAGVDLLETRAKGLSRYVRVRSKHIAQMASRIEDVLSEGGLREAERELISELTDLLEHVTWFSKRGGIAASQVRRRAEIDRLWIRVTLDDLVLAQSQE